MTKQRLLVGGVSGSQVSGDKRGHVVEQVSATLVPFSSRKIFLVWFFVVAPQHREQGEATDTCMGLNPGSLDRNPIRLKKKQMHPPWPRLRRGHVIAMRRKPLDVSAGAIHRLCWLKPTAIAKGLGDHIDTPMPPLLNLAGGEEQQFNRDPVMGELPTQGIRFHKPRMAGQPGIGHGDQ